MSARILGYPDPKAGQFIMDIDASNNAFGCVLSQVQENCERVIAYGNRALTTAERNYIVLCYTLRNAGSSLFHEIL